MAKATTIKDALKKLEETRGVSAADLEKVSSNSSRQLIMHLIRVRNPIFRVLTSFTNMIRWICVASARQLRRWMPHCQRSRPASELSVAAEAAARCLLCFET